MSAEWERTKPSRVLVIDDDPSIAEDYLESHMRDYSRHEFVTRETAEAGLTELRGTSVVFDLVIVDYQLDPGWTALKFIQEAKAIRPHLPYVIWSVHNEKEIHDRLRHVSIDTMLRVEAIGFIQKKKVLHRTDALDDYIDQAVVRYRHQIVSHMANVMVGTFREVELSLTQVTTIRRSLDNACRTSLPAPIALRPLRVRALQAEQRLRRLLNYDPVRREAGSDSEPDSVVEDLLASRAADIPKTLANVLRDLALKDSPSTVKLRTFSKALGAVATQENTQSSVAECIAELLDFLVADGRKDRAVTISGELWSAANSNWSFAPRIVCGVSHAWTLAACGKHALAEQLAAGILGDAQHSMAEAHFEELSRTVMAEIDGRAREEFQVT